MFFSSRLRRRRDVRLMTWSVGGVAACSMAYRRPPRHRRDAIAATRHRREAPTPRARAHAITTPRRRLAQRKHFPSLNWLISYTKYMRVLEPFFNDFDPSYSATRNKARDVLQQEDALTEIVQLVGKESLSEDQKVVMEVAKIIREDFLQQNAFTDYDFTCPLVKSVGMLKCIMAFYDHCQKAIADSPADAKVTWATIKVAQASIIQKVVDTKFVEPKEQPEKIKAHYDELVAEIEASFAAMLDV